jgi:hypothetical protein
MEFQDSVVGLGALIEKYFFPNEINFLLDRVNAFNALSSS